MIERKAISDVISFHGHMCPGLAMGIRAAEIALEEIGPHSGDEEIVAITETDMCGVDAVQFLTGCTFGKGNLIHRDYGKNVYTFLRRSDGRAIRISTRPDGWGSDHPEREPLRAKLRTGGATEEERKRLWELQRERSERILAMPVEDIYEVREVDVPSLPLARVHASIPCAFCGEATMETRIRRFGGRELCPPCFEDAIAGRSPVDAPSVGR